MLLALPPRNTGFASTQSHPAYFQQPSSSAVTAWAFAIPPFHRWFATVRLNCHTECCLLIHNTFLFHFNVDIKFVLSRWAAKFGVRTCKVNLEAKLAVRS